MKICPYCKEEKDDKAGTCPHCGKTEVSLGNWLFAIILLWPGFCCMFYILWATIAAMLPK